MRGAIIQPTDPEQDAAGWSNVRSALGAFPEAPRDSWGVSEPFGNLHPHGCGCEGCKQSGVVAKETLGSMSDLAREHRGILLAAVTLAGFYIIYKKVLKQ